MLDNREILYTLKTRQQYVLTTTSSLEEALTPRTLRPWPYADAACIMVLWVDTLSASLLIYRRCHYYYRRYRGCNYHSAIYLKSRCQPLDPATSATPSRGHLLMPPGVHCGSILLARRRGPPQSSSICTTVMRYFNEVSPLTRKGTSDKCSLTGFHSLLNELIQKAYGYRYSIQGRLCTGRGMGYNKIEGCYI